MLPLLLTALAMPLAAQNPKAPQPAGQPPFSETIEVREVDVRVDLSALPTFESIGKKGREDFIVLENGIAYPLTGLGPAEAAEWIFVLYFDSVLAGPEARQRAAIELAGQADRLTAGGLAEIVVADPLPHTLLTTGSADALRRQLDELALAAARETTPAATSLTSATATRLAQLDRLTVEIAARGGGGARGLLLPVGAWPLDPEALSRLTNTAPRTAEGSAAAAANERPEFLPLRETAQVLAGYGWVTVPLALRAPREVAEPSAAEKRTQVSMGGGGDQRTTVPIVSISGNGEPTDPATAARVDTLTDFSLIPYAELSRASSGALVGESGRLQGVLGDLRGRRLFTYRSPFPQPGRLLPLEVRWQGGDGRTLPAPRWLRSSTPPEVAAARLRRMLAGDPAAQSPQAAKTDGIQWNAETGRVCFPGDGDKRWVRLSTATEKDGQIQLATGQPVQIERTAAGLCLDAPTTTGGRTVRLAEDLENETWTSAVRPAN
ncbi:MAG: hypothetical protein ABI689_17440 [Thermoanaerobaculia bacterium]